MRQDVLNPDKIKVQRTSVSGSLVTVLPKFGKGGFVPPIWTCRLIGTISDSRGLRAPATTFTELLWFLRHAASSEAAFPFRLEVCAASIMLVISPTSSIWSPSSRLCTLILSTRPRSILAASVRLSALFRLSCRLSTLLR